MDVLEIVVVVLREPFTIGFSGVLAIAVVFAFYLASTFKDKTPWDKLARLIYILVTGAVSLFLAAVSLAGMLLNLLLPTTT
jgi:multisubunit Na+/H+ antiporter MnhB subunit